MKLEVGLNIAHLENLTLHERVILKWENVDAILLRASSWNAIMKLQSWYKEATARVCEWSDSDRWT
jgi:hypothetical protein